MQPLCVALFAVLSIIAPLAASADSKSDADAKFNAEMKAEFARPGGNGEPSLDQEFADMDSCYKAWHAHDFASVVPLCETARHENYLSIHNKRLKIATLDPHANHESYYFDRSMLASELLSTVQLSYNIAAADAMLHDGPSCVTALRAARTDFAAIDVSDLKRGTDPAETLRTYARIKSQLDALAH